MHHLKRFKSKKTSLCKRFFYDYIFYLFIFDFNYINHYYGKTRRKVAKHLSSASDAQKFNVELFFQRT